MKAMARIIKMKHENPNNFDLERFNRLANERWNNKLGEKFPKLDAKSQWRAGEFRSSQESSVWIFRWSRQKRRSLRISEKGGMCMR